MPCDSRAVTQEQKQAQADAVKELELDIATGKRTLIRQFDGSISILNWGNSQANKIGMCEGCVLERISNGSNWVAKSKLQAWNVHPTKQYLAGGHSHGKGHK
jgi:hypothetical protein